MFIQFKKIQRTVVQFTIKFKLQMFKLLRKFEHLSLHSTAIFPCRADQGKPE